MALTAELWRDLFHQFDPQARLEAVDSDLYVERPGAVAKDIADDLRPGQ